MSFHWTQPVFGPGIIDARRVIFYGRWSDASQGDGDSLARQTGAKLVAYVERLGIPWKNVEIIIDDGKSASDGTHRLKGRLKGILDRAKAGKLKGWHLIAEDPDRLSREDETESLGMLTDLVRAGVCVHVLKHDAWITQASKNLMFMMQFLLGAAVANEETIKKKERIVSAKQAHRKAILEDEPGVHKNRPPCWYELEYDPKTRERCAKHVIPERRLALQRMFDLRLEGKGTPTVARMLNEEKHDTFSKGWVYRQGPKKGQPVESVWTQGSVIHFLRNRAVMGYWQPMERDPNRPKGTKHMRTAGKEKKIYEEIISPEKFDRVQELLAGHDDVHGKSSAPHSTASKGRNVLSGMIKCGHCGKSMVAQFKSKRNMTQLHCSRGHSDTCDNTLYFNFDKIVGGVVNLVRTVDAPEDAGEELLNAQLTQARSTKARLIQQRAKWAANATEEDFLMEQVVRVTKEIKEVDAKERELKAALERARGVQMPVGDRKAAMMKLFERIDLNNMDAPPETVDARSDLRELLREFVVKVECVDYTLAPDDYGHKDRQVYVTLVADPRRYVLSRIGDLIRVIE